MAPIATGTTPAPAPEFHQSVSDLSKNPLERTWRGNREGTLKIDAYPEFMHATDEEGLLKKREWVKLHLAVAFRFWGKMGYGEGIRWVRVRVWVSVWKWGDCDGYLTTIEALVVLTLQRPHHRTRPDSERSLLDEPVWCPLLIHDHLQARPGHSGRLRPPNPRRAAAHQRESFRM